MKDDTNERSGLIALLAMVVVVLVTMLALFVTWRANLDKNEDTDSNVDTNDEVIEIATDEITNMVKDKFNETYLYLASANAYCNDSQHQGSTDKIGAENGFNGFYASSQFTSYDEMIAFLKTIMAEDIINKYKYIRKEYYIDRDGKLYCADLGKGGMYSYNVYNLKVNDASDTEITADATMELVAPPEGENLYEDFLLTLQKNDDNWIVTSYNRK